MSQIKKLLSQLTQLEYDQRLNRIQFNGTNPIGLYIFKKRLTISQELTILRSNNNRKAKYE